MSVCVAIYVVLLKPFPQGTCRPECYTCGICYSVVFINLLILFQNPYTGVRPVDIGTVNNSTVWHYVFQDLILLPV
jgi:hypothetical protein